MSISDRWSVLLSAQETGGETIAVARLAVNGEQRLAGKGKAHLNPDDQAVKKIGTEIAVSRALADLAHKLLREAAADIEDITHSKPHLHA